MTNKLAFLGVFHGMAVYWCLYNHYLHTVDHDAWGKTTCADTWRKQEQRLAQSDFEKMCDIVCS